MSKLEDIKKKNGKKRSVITNANMKNQYCANLHIEVCI